VRESVSAVFKSLDGKIFTIDRQNYLSVFPGYTSFPGGKVDKKDGDLAEKGNCPFPEINPIHWVALKREIKEELNFCLDEHQDLVETCYLFGTAVTPEFNPYRFKAHFFIIQLKEAFPFDVDKGEAKASCWEDPKSLLQRYQKGEILAVPPVVAMVEKLASDILPEGEQNLTLPHIEGREVPMIESIYGVKQFLPLSNTFPPANRTNCFIIGDEPLRLLVDPSPKNDEEKEKLKRSIDKVGFDAFFISHHHPDHHEFLPDLHKDYQKPVYMSETTHQFISNKWGEDYLKPMDIKFLKEGDVLGTTLGKKLYVYEVPGHDEGQLALAPEDLSWFFVGDLIQTIGTVVIGDVEGDMAKYFDSLEKVIKLNPRFIIPSHGISLGGTEKLKMTLKHRKHREEQIKELMDQGKTEEEILAVVYEGLDERLVRYALKTIRAHQKKIISERG
jgi:ribonuclease/clavin/mitogillin